MNTTGGEPAPRNASSAGESADPCALSYATAPVMVTCGGQSGCGAASARENMASTPAGACAPSKIACAPRGKPSEARSWYTGRTHPSDTRRPPSAIQSA